MHKLKGSCLFIVLTLVCIFFVSYCTSPPSHTHTFYFFPCLQSLSCSVHLLNLSIPLLPHLNFHLCSSFYVSLHHEQKLALRESNISRYKEEFHEVCLIGSGSFGTVYKCINRLDGCVYALKRSHKPVVGSGDE